MCRNKKTALSAGKKIRIKSQSENIIMQALEVRNGYGKTGPIIELFTGRPHI
jgi:hypothetical protein